MLSTGRHSTCTLAFFILYSIENVAAMTIHSCLHWFNMDDFLFEHNFSSLFLQTLPLCHSVGSYQLFQPAVDNTGTEKFQVISYKCRLFTLQASNLLYVWHRYESVLTVQWWLFISCTRWTLLWSKNVQIIFLVNLNN